MHIYVFAIEECDCAKKELVKSHYASMSNIVD